MDIFQAIVLGIVEGFTEFLPISSTGHMIVVADWMKMDENAENKAFMVIIQLAAILAVVLNYKDKFSFSKINLWIKVMIAFLPLAGVGFIFKELIKSSFTPQIVAYMFIIGGIVFLIVEYFYKEKEHDIDDVEDISYKQAGWIGFAQIFALIPGTSRAGASIIGALLVGLSRKASSEFSFLLAVPVMIVTSGYDILKHYDEFTNESVTTLAIGFVTAFIVAYFTMKLFIVFLQKFTFTAFGIYRILFGIGLLLWI